MTKQYFRTCQSCGYQQAAKDPKTYVDKAKTEPWRDVKCRKCGSADLDYGRYRDNEAVSEEQSGA